MKDKYTINNLTFKFNRMKKHLFAALIAACAVVTTACDDTEETKYFYGFGTVALRNEQVVIKQYDYTYYTNLLNTNFNYSDGDRVYFECRSTTEYSEKEYAVSVIGISYNIKKDIVRYADLDAVPDSVNGSTKITPTTAIITRDPKTTNEVTGTANDYLNIIYQYGTTMADGNGDYGCVSLDPECQPERVDTAVIVLWLKHYQKVASADNVKSAILSVPVNELQVMADGSKFENIKLRWLDSKGDTAEVVYRYSY